MSLVPDDVRSGVLAEVERRADETLALLRELVRTPSETHPPGGDEGPAQALLAAELRSDRLDVDVFEPTSVAGVEQHPGWWPGLDYAGRPNVVAMCSGAGGGRSLILNGHMDVVPAGPRDAWLHDPYGAEIHGRRLYGRGTADMKAGIVAAVAALRCVRAAGYETQGAVIVESVVNEELGGYNGTLACCVKGYAADAAIVAEPTRLRVSPASKGGQVYRATTRGRPAHSSLWSRGLSALDGAIAIKAALRSWEDLRTRELAGIPFFSDREDYDLPAQADTIWHLAGGDPEVMAHPESAELRFWVDHLPGEDREDLLARFERHVAEHVAAEPALRDVPPGLERAVMRPFTAVSVDSCHPLVDVLLSATETVTDRRPRLLGFPGACDSMIFNLYTDTPALVFGPGDLAVAHAPDESIDIDEVQQAVAIFALAILGWCGGRKRRAPVTATPAGTAP